LISVIRRWRRDDLKPQTKADLERLEGEVHALEVERGTLDEKRASLAQDIQDDTNRLHRIRRRIEGLSAFVHRHDEARLKQTKERLQEERAEIGERVSAQLPRDIALLLNPSLVKRAIERLDQVLGSDAHACARVLDLLLDRLPGLLFDEPEFPDPDIRRGQRA